MTGHKYPIEANWRVHFRDMGISSQDALRYAGLPLDLLSRKPLIVTAEEYFRLWDGVATVLRDNPTFPLDLATSRTPESFSPPLFAAFCSQNLNIAAKRITYYKPLVCPLNLSVETTLNQTTIKIGSLSDYDDPSSSVILMELIWWVHMARLATREHLVPLRIHTSVNITEQTVYEDYFRTHITKSDFNGVTFSAQDAVRPFLTANDAMWSFFEPQLNQRMQDLTQNATYTEKVRACLIEILASGQYKVEDVASRLAVSRRTLQRHLSNEGTTFQQVLDGLRKELAHHYLAKSEYSSGQIAFLLGYEDPNSFSRAFRSWTGQTPDAARARVS
ncbi:MAG: AraC family transcriptional regulator ligand-binding domain-containing protein [Chloroflexota bacterium]